ncbi:hypothetical protein [Metabacillus malikii]|uniref:YtzI protein n=1 Tax=Metabacillus malikii TaxID=1504265 RepID=A0ABT9ZJD4_9BACI|nr:hypothetical protein [Metabacillus malikii]MDQ0231648.1 hypothetical protein [Metabacillus malikii]
MIKIGLFTVFLIGTLAITILLIIFLLNDSLNTNDSSQIDPLPNDDEDDLLEK